MGRRKDIQGGARRGAAGGRSAFGLGILRTMVGSSKRFVALATICALGVTMLVGLKVACIDLRASADRFFDSQDLFDVRVQSTMGLTDEDVSALAELDGVDVAEGGYTETVYAAVGSGSEKVDVKALSPAGLNEPQVLEGNLPVTADQIAVTRRYAEEAGLGIGDTVSFHGADDGASDAGADSDSDADAASVAASAAVFERKDYTISAIVLDPTDINAGNGTMSFRWSGGSQYAFFVLPAAATSEAYTVVYLTVEGASEPLCYTGTYEELVDSVVQQVEGVREEREAARGEGLRADANATIDEQEADAQSQLDDAQSQLDDAQAELDSGAAELADGQAQLDSGYAQLGTAERELATNEAQVNAGLSQIAAGLDCSVDQIPATLDARRADLAAGRTELAAGRNQLEAGRSQLAAARAQITSTVQLVASLPYVRDVWPAAAWNRLASAKTVAEAEAAAAELSAAVDPFVSQATLSLDALVAYLRSDEVASAGSALDRLPEAVQQRIAELVARLPEQVQPVVNGLLSQTPAQVAAQLESMRDMVAQMSQLAPGMVEIVRGEVQLSESEAQLADGEAQLAAGESQLNEAADGYAQLVAARSQLEAGRSQIDANRKTLDANAAELADGRAELEDGQAQLDDAQTTLDQERADALALIADARAQVGDIDDATWYVQDRSSLGSYASVESDASSIEAIGTVIPLVFFVVAVLISLTTMTRMVEEERGLIGLYKALGYGRGTILSKYVAYAAAACAVGGVVGNVLGFVVLPLILFTIFSTMYALPEFVLQFDVLYAVASTLLFAVGIVGATVLTCRRELRESPASLMLPKAPRAGARIFLEYLRPLWRRLGFLNKVTARNIFRYKRRFLMTVFGIAGTTALLVCGFGIRDTVLSLSGRQYGDAGVIGYDLMAVTSPDDLEDFATDLSDDARVASFVPVGVDSLTLTYGERRESVQLVIVPNGISLDGYVRLVGEDGHALALPDTGAVITKNAEQVLGFSVGDEVHAQDSALVEANVAVDAVCQNYLGNTVFMSQSAYERAFGETGQLNGLLANLEGDEDEQIAFAEELSGDGRALSVVSTAKLVRDFSSAFTLINTVVYVVIVLAAALSFTVVFTLSNTNISERERELATIKVLGFRAREVHRYINKETLILTGMGVLVGLPLGYALTRSLTWILKMPSLYFDTVVEPPTYVIAAVLAFAFTLLVNLLTNRALDRVDMVGALKSAE